LSSADAEEFRSLVYLRLLEDNYRILQRFQGRSSLRTFLTVVILRQCLDYRIAQWGKWRPSAGARRLGPMAVRLERMVLRDGLTCEQACAVIQSVGETVPPNVQDVRSRSGRCRRRTVGEEFLEHVPAEGAAPDANLHAEEVKRATSALDDAMASLSAEDRSLLRSRFVDELTVAEIAARSGLDQRLLYRRMSRALRQLKAHLEARGVTVGDFAQRSGFTLTSWQDCVPQPA
jgi:RNA polymerase sigma factor (sigma-70 family)